MAWARFVWSYVAYRRDLLAVVLACAVVMAAAELSIPWLIKDAIDAVLDPQGEINLNRWALLTLGILAALSAGHVLLQRADAQMVLHCSYKLRQRLFTHLHAQALPFFQRHRTGELIHRLTSDTKVFEAETAKLFGDLPAELLVVIGVVALMLLLHPGLALLIIAFMAATAAVTGYLGQPLPTLRKSAQQLMAGLSARLQEGITGVRTVQAFKNEGYELARLERENRRVLDVELREGHLHALMEPLGDLLELLGLVLVVWYGGHLILAHQISAGTLVAFIAYMEILARPLGRAEGYYRSLQSSRAVAERLEELLNDREMLPERGKRSFGERAPEIVVDGIAFRHPGSEREVISDVSFRVQPGEVVAVTGRNGAGKSTLMDLLLRFYDPTAGRILAAGVDLREWDLEAWRRSAGVMTQDVFLFHGTILENIAYGRPEARPEDIEQAVRDSGLDQVLKRFPDRLETIVGERGAQLSGGERQAIALARLFLRKPTLLILDEPTSQLDGEALHDVCAALRPLLAQSTAFIVAHDCETMQLAKRVLFLENGRLAGDGTHDELFARNARYRALWEEQSGQPRIAPSDATREIAIRSPATPAPTSLADQEQRERADGSGAMVPSLERPRAGTADAGYPIEIELANGRRIRVYATADMTALLRIVEALESRRV